MSRMPRFQSKKHLLISAFALLFSIDAFCAQVDDNDIVAIELIDLSDNNLYPTENQRKETTHKYNGTNARITDIDTIKSIMESIKGLELTDSLPIDANTNSLYFIRATQKGGLLFSTIDFQPNGAILLYHKNKTSPEILWLNNYLVRGNKRYGLNDSIRLYLINFMMNDLKKNDNNTICKHWHQPLSEVLLGCAYVNRPPNTIFAGFPIKDKQVVKIIVAMLCDKDYVVRSLMAEKTISLSHAGKVKQFENINDIEIWIKTIKGLTPLGASPIPTNSDGYRIYLKDNRLKWKYDANYVNGIIEIFYDDVAEPQLLWVSQFEIETNNRLYKISDTLSRLLNNVKQNLCNK